MFHHRIITRGNHELRKKVYMKQKEIHTKGDWFRMMLKDFEFIGDEMNEEIIRNTPKEEYRKNINAKIKAAAFIYYLKIKEKSKRKMKPLTYTALSIQPYLTMDCFSIQEKKLLFSLRSQCYNAKNNFKKMNRGNLRCSLNCDAEESQTHVFQ